MREVLLLFAAPAVVAFSGGHAALLLRRRASAPSFGEPVAPVVWQRPPPRAWPLCEEVAVASSTPLEEIPAPRGISRVFLVQVFAGFLGTVGVFALLLSAVEQWRLVDALYFTTTTLATIGFGDLKPTRPLGRLLTALLGVVGVFFLGGLLSALVGEWERQRGRSDDEAVPLSGLAGRPWAQSGALLGIGVLGYRACEPCSSWAEAVYLIACVMTTAGVGDVVPSTAAAKLFLSFYAPCAVLGFARVLGALAVRPLDAAKRAAQRAVLARYANGLTVEKLDEVARGPVVKRLGLSTDDSFCTRNEFTLLTLVLQGKIGEADLLECRQAFENLDLTGDGRITIEDLELARQSRLLRVVPKLRRRGIRRTARGLKRQLRLAVTTPFKEQAERLFPHWRKGRGAV